MSATKEIILEKYHSLKSQIEKLRSEGQDVSKLEQEASALALCLKEGSPISEGKTLLKG